MIKSLFSLIPAQLTQSPDGYLWTDMSALPATENANITWQRVREALAGASPATQLAFKSLKTYLSTQKGNPNLRFTALTAEALTTDSSNADGTQAGAGTGTIHAVYVKKRSTNGTDAFVKILDEATIADYFGASLTTVRITLPLLVASDEAIFISPQGAVVLLGIRAACTTTSEGTTVSTLAATSGDGFILSA